MRDTDRLREKLEVHLDSRQLFFLIFGGAVLACLVFVVGIMTGKRLEARSVKRQRPVTDELTLVDEESRTATKGLTFHDELVKPDSRSLGNVPKEVGEWKDMGQAPKPADPKVAAEAPKGGKGKGMAPAAAVVKVEAEPKADAAETAEAAPGDGGEAKPAPVPARKYTLQVSAFQSKEEAEQMLKKLQEQGLRPYLSATSVASKGVWYRVRVGNFPSWKHAVDAKRKFEEQLNMTAYVSRR
jgi:DedD protein